MRDEELLAMRLSIVRRIATLCDDIGKTKIQKITYFLQESVGVPVTYPFRMHYYGPYSDDLDGVLSLAQMLGYVEIKPDSDGFGYHVTPGSGSVAERFGGYNLPTDMVGSIDRATKTLGSLETAELELYATIHFIGRSREELPRDEILETVHRLKPKFSKDTIDQAYESLSRANLI
ncbi:MAG: hypothetical protein J4F43_06210 [Dehalococcoidia bacterium]|nr:hypothetical protein [Dehalococcoidia bacterium]